MKLLLIRHGESEANFANYWTGWLDVNLTNKGTQQAREAGIRIKKAGVSIDVAFESVLKRSIKTAQLVLEEADASFVPEIKTWRLNERHYGALVGRNKTKMTQQFGEEQVKKWRRGFNEVPPLVKINQFDRRYDSLDSRLIPKGESLNMTSRRVMILWQDQIVPFLKEGKTVLVCGHGNSLRALIQYLEAVPEEQVDRIKVPNATPILYCFGSDFTIKSKTEL
ncbi:2,3-bisphosphoglycerate-dependent phosphoglycerate mutase [Enterococcus pallens]|uniref:2,3-bisphosphoglycerate-dependent phosphoglycerate mutase n=1 Tax=Enterococcus pallens ATCC BAA-351 TaxID=1158607 RepID=R2SPH4_9ENTE|nr:2,3-diphosphoglycerate-dependent phosphoglycerate mutase [Enterococcus pallens]EOH90059.1 phosphoglycerate mutase 1 family protein [Enterococcus pallens ATCC BAA-351]EOU15335.1 phosphoglycerate mutase [Enterococcus pallens ATCC BAA-351]OJG77891.1 phosphoglycerate mutase 1 family protein [Enterococcus pallens]